MGYFNFFRPRQAGPLVRAARPEAAPYRNRQDAPVSRQDGGSPYGCEAVPRRNRMAGFIGGDSPGFGEYAILLP